jgi:hypothetical protein
MRYELTEQAIKNGKEVFKNMRKTCLKCNEDFAFFCQNAVIHDRRGHDRNIANHTRHAHYWGEIIDSVTFQKEFNINSNLTHFQALYILLGWQVNVERLTNKQIQNHNIYQNLRSLYRTKYDPDQKLIQSSVNVRVMDILLGSEVSDRLNLEFDDEDRSIKKDEFLVWAVDEGFLIRHQSANTAKATQARIDQNKPRNDKIIAKAKELIKEPKYKDNQSRLAKKIIQDLNLEIKQKAVKNILQ